MQSLRGGMRGSSKESYYSGVDLIAQTYAQLCAGDAEESSEEGSVPAGMIPWAQYTNEPWRDLSVQFLTDLGAKFWQQYNEKSGYTTPRIFLPFMQKGELVGYTDSYTMVKYYNAPWAKARRILYPYDYVAAMRPKTIVLVEGQIDALNLIQFGIPALCMMGTKNWSDYKRSLLKDLDIDNVFVCMDGDPAGKLAATDLFSGTNSFGSIVQDKKTKAKHFAFVENILLPDGVDPGSLTQDQLSWLKNHIGM
jgi:5S rRNA maturation endonuclease (ribonuclease M5)